MERMSGSGLKRYQVANSKKLKEKWAEEFKKQCVNTGNPDPVPCERAEYGKTDDPGDRQLSCRLTTGMPVPRRRRSSI